MWGRGPFFFVLGGIVNIFAQRLAIFTICTVGVVALGSLTNGLKPR